MQAGKFGNCDTATPAKRAMSAVVENCILSFG